MLGALSTFEFGNMFLSADHLLKY